MKYVAIQHPTRPSNTPIVARYCSSFICRLRGLTFQRTLRIDRGVLLVQKNDSRLDAAIHMLGVFFDLGIVWINSEMEVVDACLAQPWRLYYAPQRPARYTLEIHPSRLPEFQTGDKIRFEEAWVD